jgi:hypothetical protein
VVLKGKKRILALQPEQHFGLPLSVAAFSVYEEVQSVAEEEEEEREERRISPKFIAGNSHCVR